MIRFANNISILTEIEKNALNTLKRSNIGVQDEEK